MIKHCIVTCDETGSLTNALNCSSVRIVVNGFGLGIEIAATAAAAATAALGVATLVMFGGEWSLCSNDSFGEFKLAVLRFTSERLIDFSSRRLDVPFFVIDLAFFSKRFATLVFCDGE